MADRSIDRRAVFEAEAMPHLKDLYRTAARLMSTPEVAGDAVQETYLLAWKSFDRYTPGTNCKAWLFQILFNVIRHERRTWFKWLTGKDADVADTKIEAPTPVPSQLSDQNILAALDRIPSQFREVLLLVDVQEFSYKEANAMLKIPVGTVMSRLSRARAELRKHLATSAVAYGLSGGAKGAAVGKQ